MENSKVNFIRKYPLQLLLYMAWIFAYFPVVNPKISSPNFKFKFISKNCIYSLLMAIFLGFSSLDFVSAQFDKLGVKGFSGMIIEVAALIWFVLRELLARIIVINYCGKVISIINICEEIDKKSSNSFGSSVNGRAPRIFSVAFCLLTPACGAAIILSVVSSLHLFYFADGIYNKSFLSNIQFLQNNSWLNLAMLAVVDGFVHAGTLISYALIILLSILLLNSFDNQIGRAHV